DINVPLIILSNTYDAVFEIRIGKYPATEDVLRGGLEPELVGLVEPHSLAVRPLVLCGLDAANPHPDDQGTVLQARPVRVVVEEQVIPRPPPLECAPVHRARQCERPVGLPHGYLA